MRGVPTSSQDIESIKKLKAEGLTAVKIADQLGLTLSTVYEYTRKSKESRQYKCDCGNVAPKGSKFCNVCGKKILSEAGKLVEALNKLKKLEGSIPLNEVQQYHSTILAAIKYIEGIEKRNAENSISNV